MFVVSGALVSMLTGCRGETPVISENREIGDATLHEQQRWVVREVEAVMEITKTTGYWRWLAENSLRWEVEQAAILDRSRKARCTFKTGEVNPAALTVDLRSDALDRDPFVLAERVRGLWKSEGWEISDIIRKGDTETPRVYFRADRVGGALMTFEAADAPAGRMLHLSVKAECSNDPSVAW